MCLAVRAGAAVYRMEMDMVFTDAYIFQGEKGFIKGSFRVAGGRIQEILEEGGKIPDDPAGNKNAGKEDQEQEISLNGAYVLPGLVDIHTHGNSGHDFSDGSAEGLESIGKYMASHGITSFLPTSMTLPYDRLEAAFQTAAGYMKNPPDDGARVLGVHMEGPYFSEKKKGAQNSAYLKLPDADGFRELQEKCGGIIRIVDVAPELDGAEEFVRAAAKISRVSAAHTDASYEDAARAFDAGASHVTHLFNAMPPIHHRRPGVIGAGCERENVYAELICDGLHVHPSVIRMAFKLFPGRICLISDSLRCCGMPEGVYELGGQSITLKDGQARIADGNLAGAVANLYEDLVNAIHFGIKVEEAVLAATLNPARQAGMDDEIGSLETGKKADFLVCDAEWNLQQVYIGGRRIR